MGMFQQVEGEAAILVNDGVYRQVDLYTRDGYLYAKTNGGFVRLLEDSSTSKSRLRLDIMTWTGDLYRDPQGRLCEREVLKATKLPYRTTQKLLTASVRAEKEQDNG